MTSLLGIESFKRYRRFREQNAEGRAYTEPFVPVAGGEYFSAHRRFVYCGAAIWESEAVDYADDESAFDASLKFMQRHLERVGESECVHTAFWRLFDVASALVSPSAPLVRRVDMSVWTNLSKLGEREKSAPRDAKGQLRALDVEQIQAELGILRPDVLLCVSGTALVDTGNGVFAGLPKISLGIETNDTLVMRLPSGGTLIWTMHPNRKSIGWSEALIRDIAKVLELKSGTK